MKLVNDLIKDKIKLLDSSIKQNRKDIKYAEIDLNKHSEKELMFCTLLDHLGNLYIKLAQNITDKINLESYENTTE